MKKRVISFMMSAVLTLSGLGCYGLAMCMQNGYEC